jgi:thymidylate synthase
MIEIHGRDADELFVKAARALLEKGRPRSARGLKTIELEDAYLVLEDPAQPVCHLPERHISEKYLHGEQDWYKSGSLWAKDIASYGSMWESLADSNGTINSNYGYLALLQKWSGKSQYEWCVDPLRRDPQTRQAVINYNQPVHKYIDVKDFPCTMFQQFSLAGFDCAPELESLVVMRSNDLMFGLTYDMPWFCYLQLKLAKELGYDPGEYRHFAASLHVYDKHMAMLQDIAKVKKYD